MADRRRPGTTERRIRNTRNTRNAIVNANAIRKVQEIPDRREREERRRAEKEEWERSVQSQAAVRKERARRESESAVQKNREREGNITRSFVIFLFIVCVVFLFGVVKYLQLRADITTSKSYVANLEATLTNLKEENDAYYGQVSSEIDIERITKIAIGRLGMKCPSEEQKETYQTARSTYVRQYQDIPDSR